MADRSSDPESDRVSDQREASPSLYERIGGEAGIETLVFEFYKRVFADPELAPFFEGIEAERLQRMQREFFAAALGGPIQYSGRSLREVHAGRGIRMKQLQRFVDRLMETLEARGLDEADRYEIASRINTYADEITGTTPVDG